MMQFPTQAELDELTTFHEPYCLSIYVPFIKPNAATNPNRIELKNLLREAKTSLEAAGADEDTIKKTLSPARQLLTNGEFWPIRRESLVLFLHQKLFHTYSIPQDTAPYMLTVSTGFNLEPLLAAMQTNRSYYLLALGHKNVHIYEGDRNQLNILHLKDFPSNMKEELAIDEFPNWRETHTIASPQTGKGSEAYHGQYNVKQTDKIMLLEFFRRIDKRLRPFLQASRLPLILAGVEYLIPLYRQANTYHNLVGETIKGNIEHTNNDDIRQRAWAIINQAKLPMPASHEPARNMR